MSDVCRVCLGEETPEEPLFAPCKCSGSIKYVHEQCLLEWVEHLNFKTVCAVCSASYRIRKVYSEEMPSRLPVKDYAKYVANVVVSHAGVALAVARLLLVWNALAVLLYALLNVSVFLTERTAFKLEKLLGWNDLTAAVRSTMDGFPLAGAAPSRLPWVDRYLDAFVRRSFIRTAVVNGSFFIFTVCLVGLLVYHVASWVLMERAVQHDLAHIANGELSHMDKGDAEQFLESMRDAADDFDDVVDAQLEHVNVRANAAVAAGANLDDVTAVAAAVADAVAAEREPASLREIAERLCDKLEENAPLNLHDLVQFVEVSMKAENRDTATTAALRRLATLIDIADPEGAVAAATAAAGAAGATDTSAAAAAGAAGVAGAADTDRGADGTAAESESVSESESESESDESAAADTNVFIDMRRPEQVAEEEREPGIDDEDNEPIAQVLGAMLREVLHMDAMLLMNVVLVVLVYCGLVIGSFSMLYYTYLLAVQTAAIVFQTAFAHARPYLFAASDDAGAHAFYMRVLGVLEALKHGSSDGSDNSVVSCSVLGYILSAVAMEFEAVLAVRVATLLAMRLLVRSKHGRTVAMMSYVFFVVHKTLLVTVIETLMFPTFCGVLMHAALLPLTLTSISISGVSGGVARHFAVARNSPYAAAALHWFVGYVYMNYMQVFVAAARHMFRPGVLYFLHKNNSVFIMRSMILVSLPKQIRRILTSALFYAICILGGCGSAALLLRVLEPQQFPLSIFEAVDPKLCARVLPFAVMGLAAFYAPLRRSANNGEGSLRGIFVLWVSERVWIRMFDQIAERLDLGSWLFGRHRALTREEAAALRRGDTSLGYFVRAPRDIPPLAVRQSGTVFVPVTHRDRRLDGQGGASGSGVLPNEIEEYTVVWRPPHFRYRLAGLVAITWAWITAITMLLTFVPLQAGKLLDLCVCAYELKNDLARYAVGLCVMLPVYGAALKWARPVELASCLRFIMLDGDLPQPRRSDFVLGAVGTAVLLALRGVLAVLPTASAAAPSSSSASSSLPLPLLLLPLPLLQHSPLLAWIANCALFIAAAAFARAWRAAGAFWAALLVSSCVLSRPGLTLDGAIIAFTLGWPVYMLANRVLADPQGFQKNVREFCYVMEYKVANYESPEPESKAEVDIET